MIEKFTSKFREFASDENLDGLDLSDEAMVNLFGIFLDTFSKPAKPSVLPPAKVVSSSNVKVRKPDRPATYKQIGFLKRLMKQGKIDPNTDLDNITVGNASHLIDKGVNAPDPKPEPKPVEEPSGEFAGSYNQESGDTTSAADFWQ